MIVDWFISALVAFVEWVAGLLPDHSLSLPAPTAILSRLAQVDSLIPIAAPLAVAATVLAFVVVFVVVRLVLTVRHVLLP